LIVSAFGLLVELSVILGGLIVLVLPAHRSERRVQIVLAIVLGIAAIAGSFAMSLEVR
jgi:hypothetical protein